MPYNTIIHFHKMITESGDPRMNKYPMMTSPMPTITLTLAYLYFVKVAGPKMMKNKQAYDLRLIMLVYNFAMVIFSTVMFIEMGKLLNWGHFCLTCQKVDYSLTSKALKFCSLGYYFYISKFIEFADTIFFVLRKKQAQVSSLHVYHHSVVPITLWLGMKYAPGGNNSFFPFLNAGVHSVMYTYYGLSAFGPRFQKYLFWKKYITTLQLTQFIAALIHSLNNLIQGCDFPKYFVLLNLFHAVVFFYLFSNFYKKAYISLDKISEKCGLKIENQKKYINGQIIDDKSFGKNGLRIRTVINENSKSTSASISGLTISLIKENQKNN